MKTAVMTVAIGDSWKRILEVSGPTIEAYARRIGADYVPITQEKFKTQLHAYEKLRVRELLAGEYERVTVIDADCLVRGDTPNLFDMVPAGRFGAYAEPSDKEERRKWLDKTYIDHAKSLEMKPPGPHDYRYFSSGVFVADRSHATMFADPPRFAFCFYEQTYLNLKLLELRLPLFVIPQEFNSWWGEYRDKAYIPHYPRSLLKFHVEEFCGLLEGRKAVWRKAGLL